MAFLRNSDGLLTVGARVLPEAIGGRIKAGSAHRDYLAEILNQRRTSGEYRAVARFIDGMRASGWDCYAVHDGDTTTITAHTVEALALVFNLDQASLRFRRIDGTGKTHGVLIVLGNDPDGSEVVADWNFSEGDADGFDSTVERVNGYETE